MKIQLSISVHRSLTGEFDMGIDQLKLASQSVKNLITSLLKVEPSTRLSASECLHHQWIKTQKKLRHQNTLTELETHWMKKCLARLYLVIIGQSFKFFICQEEMVQSYECLDSHEDDEKV